MFAEVTLTEYLENTLILVGGIGLYFLYNENAWQSVTKPFRKSCEEDGISKHTEMLPVKEGRLCSSLAYSSISRNKPTLFLDIDGVLHRFFNESLERLPLLENFLHQYDCQIVISSTWRETCREDYLAHCLGETVWQRVVGFTPKLPYLENQPTREREISYFATTFQLKNIMALDDDTTEFSHLVPVHFTNQTTGLTETNIAYLESWYLQCQC